MPNASSRVMRHHLLLPRPYTAPRNKIEETLEEIWRAALNIDCVGVEDDFTDLGGDSFDAEVIVTMIEEKLGVHTPLSTLARAPTVAALAEAVQRMQKKPR